MRFLMGFIEYYKLLLHLKNIFDTDVQVHDMYILSFYNTYILYTMCVYKQYIKFKRREKCINEKLL